jgi:mRNA-degrading endonuclease RelE of RelBE toxin-antitoxin system
MLTIIMVRMGRREPFAIIYDPRVNDHLRTIDSKYYSLIRETIRQQLEYDPQVETRNRKALARDVEFDADWELRFGPDNRFRVFFTVALDKREVYVLAIGVKRGSRLYIAEEEIEL